MVPLVPLLVFLISCCLLYIAYNQTYNYFTYDTVQFQHLDENRKYYICKNVVKGTYLSMLVIAGIVPVYFGLVEDIWDDTMFKILASMYVSNDVVGMFRVKKLPTTTRLHHTASVVLLMMAWSIDFNTNNTGQLLVLYTYFSALAFPVNLYLGLRFLYELSGFRYFTKYLYLCTCSLNWVLQLYYANEVNYLYIGLICIIIVDDIVLLKWLFK
jgi:hypothetical protein